MCNSTSLGHIQDVTTDWVNDGRMFTAFEVSLEVQKRVRAEGGQPERHRHMKTAIHQEMDQYLQTGLYGQNLQDVGAPDPAFVYHPPGEDPANYTPLSRKDDQQKPTPATPAQPQPVAASSTPNIGLAAVDDDDDGDQTDSVGRKPDQRGTLTVPNYMLRAAGFQPKDVAYVTRRNDSGTDVLVLSKRATTQPVTTYTVDYASNVRVTAKVLGECNIGGPGVVTYDFDGTSDEVVVKKHQ